MANILSAVPWLALFIGNTWGFYGAMLIDIVGFMSKFIIEYSTHINI
jgi:hypothetical protein